MRNLCALVILFGLPVMAEKKVIAPAELAANPNFSPAVLVDGTLYVSGQIGWDAKANAVPAEFESEVKLAMSNIGVILKAAGMTFKDVVSVQIYLTDMDLFARMNTVYQTFVPEPRPARTTVGVSKLARPGARIEVTVTARK